MIRLVAIHGIGSREPNYAELFARHLKSTLGEPVELRSVYWDDLTDYKGLGTELASKLDYAMDVIRYWTRWRVRKEMRRRIKEAVWAQRGGLERAILVTHSWGGVLAWNFVPHDAVDLWVNFHSRRYLPTLFNRPPRVGRWVNYWSPADILSGKMDHEHCTDIEVPGRGHTPMWTSNERALWVMQHWRSVDPVKEARNGEEDSNSWKRETR